MCNYNGMTILNSLQLVEQASSATTIDYAIDLTHYLCNGRTMCIAPYVPPTSSITASVLDYTDLGNDVWMVDIILSGVLTYQPYGCNCRCLKQDAWTVKLSIPVSATSEPKVTLTIGTPVVAPIAPCDCRCNTSNAVSMQISMVVTLATTPTTETNAAIYTAPTAKL